MKIESLEQISFDERIKTVEWHGNEIEVKWALSLEEMMSFVNTVVEGCFDEESKEYYPENKDFLIKKLVLSFYAGISCSVDDLGRAYDCIYRTNIYKTIFDNINHFQFEQIIKAIDSKIKNILNENIASMTSQIRDLIESFNEMQNQVGDLFKDINAEDMANIATALSNGNISEEKIVEAIVNRNTVKSIE